MVPKQPSLYDSPKEESIGKHRGGLESIEMVCAAQESVCRVSTREMPDSHWD